MEPYRDLAIARQASKVLTLFEMVLKSYDEQELSENGIPRDAIVDRQARFRAWIEDIGAQQCGEASLDYPLTHPYVRLEVLKLLKQLCMDLDILWHFVSGARAQLTWTSLDNAASPDSSIIEGSDYNNDVDNVPQIAEVLVKCKTDTEKAKINHEQAVRNIQRTQAQATSNNANASLQGTKKDCIETGDLTTLHESALKGDVKSIKAALEEGANIEELSPDGATPLTLAASQGHCDAIKELLASGANINGTSRKGWTALMTAVRHRNARTVEQLIFNGADMDFFSPDRWTALLEASYQGLEEIMGILLQCGANPYTCSTHDRTALMHASYKGDEAIVRLLLEADSDTEATSVHGETAISLGASEGHTNIVRMLLMYGCAPEPAWAKDQKGSCKDFSQNIKVEEIGESEDRMHAPGWTPLMLASQGGYVEIGRMLLERHVNVDARSPDGKTALDVASENGRVDMALMLEFARHNNAMMVR